MFPIYLTLIPIFVGLATFNMSPRNRCLLISPFLLVFVLNYVDICAKKVISSIFFFGKIFIIIYFSINQLQDVLSLPSIVLLLITFYNSAPFQEKIYQQFCFCGWLVLMAFSQIVSSKEVKNVIKIVAKHNLT